MDPVLECYLKKDKVSISREEAGAPKTDGDALVCNVPKNSCARSFDEILFFHFFCPFQFWKAAFKFHASREQPAALTFAPQVKDLEWSRIRADRIDALQRRGELSLWQGSGS